MLHSIQGSIRRVLASAVLAISGNPSIATPRKVERLDQRSPSSTKSGPGRKHLQGDPDAECVVRPAGICFTAYGRGLANQFARRNLRRLIDRRDRRLNREMGYRSYRGATGA